jgi:arylsulfatase A-like enzyme
MGDLICTADFAFNPSSHMKLLHLLAPSAVGLAATLVLASSARAAEVPPKPNVLFIAIDDLNDWIGCMKGHPQAITPNIDKLASRGVLFDNAHCAAPVCLASRTAVFSGRMPERTGVYSNWGKTKGKPPASDLQLPLHLSGNGYETLGAGKLYHGAEPKLFDEYFDTEQRWGPFTQDQARYTVEELPSKGSKQPRHLINAGPGGRDWVLPLNGLPSERNADGREGESFDWGPVEVKDEEMGDTRITDWAIRKLGEARARPFFLGVGYYRPHIPLFAPKRDFEKLPPVQDILLPEVEASDLEDLGDAGRTFVLDPITAGTHELVVNHGQWREAVRAYLACITYVDRQIGRLLEKVDGSPFADNTWIILWSDHGWQLGEKQHWGKWTGWRQTTRIPLMVVPPQGQQTAARGQVCHEPVSLVDLYPTLIDICHLPPKEGLDGRTLVPLITEPGKDSGRAVLTTFDPGNHALTTRSWRYLRYQNGEEELYDIQSDPREWHNLVKDERRRAKLDELRAQLDRELKQMESR